MNLGSLVIAAALFGSQIKALLNGDDVIGPPEPPPPPPSCPNGFVWDGRLKQCIPRRL